MKKIFILSTEEKLHLLNELFIIDDKEKESKINKASKKKRSRKRSDTGNTESKFPNIEGRKELKQFYKEAIEKYERYFPYKAASLACTDLIEIAFDKLASGEREWDVKKYPNALAQLRLAFTSELNNIYKTERINRRISNVEDGEIRDVPAGEILQKVSVSSDKTDENIDAKNKVNEIKHFVSENMTKNDRSVLEYLDSDITNKEIGKAVGLAEKTVENIKTKLRKKLRARYPNDYKNA